MFNKLFLLFIFFIVATPVLAVSVTITDKPSSIFASPFSLTVSVFGADPGKNYLRADLFKEGTQNYFGETYNGSQWYSGSVGTSYFSIDISSSDSTVSATFQAQFGNPTANEYPGPGAYKIRIRRYTASSYTSSDSYDVTIDVPLPTASITQTNTPTKTPTSTQVVSTFTPTPTKTVTKTPTATVKQTTISPTPEETGDILGTTIAPTSTPVASASASKSMQPVIISLLFVGAGLGLLSGVFVWKKRNAHTKHLSTTDSDV